MEHIRILRNLGYGFLDTYMKGDVYLYEVTLTGQKRNLILVI